MSENEEEQSSQDDSNNISQSDFNNDGDENDDGEQQTIDKQDEQQTIAKQDEQQTIATEELSFDDEEEKESESDQDLKESATSPISPTTPTTGNKKRKNEEGDTLTMDEEEPLTPNEERKTKKLKLTKKSRKSQEEDDQSLGEELSAATAKELCNKMINAFNQDKESIRNRKPATQKLILLPEVVQQASKMFMHHALIEADFLSILANWIAVLDDGSLPNMNVRTAVLKALTEFPVSGESSRLRQRRDDFEGIEKEHLKESKIAYCVKVLAEHPKETSENRKLAHDLLQRWSRLVFNLTEDYRKLSQYEEQEPFEERRSKRLNKQYQSKKEPEKPKNPGDPGYKIRAQVPKIEGFDFKKRPVSKINKNAKPIPPPPSVSSSINSFQSPTQRRMAKKLLDMKRAQKKFV